MQNTTLIHLHTLFAEDDHQNDWQKVAEKLNHLKVGEPFTLKEAYQKMGFTDELLILLRSDLWGQKYAKGQDNVSFLMIKAMIDAKPDKDILCLLKKLNTFVKNGYDESCLRAKVPEKHFPWRNDKTYEDIIESLIFGDVDYEQGAGCFVVDIQRYLFTQMIYHIYTGHIGRVFQNLAFEQNPDAALAKKAENSDRTLANPIYHCKGKFTEPLLTKHQLWEMFNLHIVPTML